MRMRYVTTIVLPAVASMRAASPPGDAPQGPSSGPISMHELAVPHDAVPDATCAAPHIAGGVVPENAAPFGTSTNVSGVDTADDALPDGSTSPPATENVALPAKSDQLVR